MSADAPNRDELLGDDGSKYSSGDDDYWVRVAGFRVIHYDADLAIINIVFTVTGPDSFTYGSSIYHMVWESGDWKLLPQEDYSKVLSRLTPD